MQRSCSCDVRAAPEVAGSIVPDLLDRGMASAASTRLGHPGLKAPAFTYVAVLTLLSILHTVLGTGFGWCSALDLSCPGWDAHNLGCKLG